MAKKGKGRGSRGQVGGAQHSNRYAGHMGTGHGAGSHSQSSGSHAHVGETKGPGEAAGADELFSGSTDRHGPGPLARRIAGSSNADFPSRETPSGAAPKGMKVQRTDDP